MTPGKETAFSDALDRLAAFGRAPPRVRAAPPHHTTLTATLRACHVWCKKVLGLEPVDECWFIIDDGLNKFLVGPRRRGGG